MEKAYCFFRTNRLDEATNELENADGSLQPVKELKAQVVRTAHSPLSMRS